MVLIFDVGTTHEFELDCNDEMNIRYLRFLCAGYASYYLNDGPIFREADRTITDLMLSGI